MPNFLMPNWINPYKGLYIYIFTQLPTILHLSITAGMQESASLRLDPLFFRHQTPTDDGLSEADALADLTMG